MKNLKVKFGLFSLLAVLAVSVILASCEQESIIPRDEIEVNELMPQDQSIGLLLPQDIVNKGEGAVNEHLDNVAPAEITKYFNNYLTMKFLEGKDKLTAVWADYEGGPSFDEINLSKYLSENELAELSNSFVNTLENTNLNLRACYYIPGKQTCTTPPPRCNYTNWAGQCIGGWTIPHPECTYHPGYYWCTHH